MLQCDMWEKTLMVLILLLRMKMKGGKEFNGFSYCVGVLFRKGLFRIGGFLLCRTPWAGLPVGYLIFFLRSDWGKAWTGTGKWSFQFPLREKFPFPVINFSRSGKNELFPFPVFPASGKMKFSIPVPFPISRPSLILLLKIYRELQNFS